MSLVHLHLMLNHVPVVGVLFLVALFAAAAVRGNATLLRTALWTCVALAAIAAVVFLTGEPAEEAVESLAGTSEQALERHEDVAKVATVLIALAGGLSLAALLLLRRQAQVPRWIGIAGVAGSLALAAVMGVTANLGGQIRHAEIRTGATTPATEESGRSGDADDH